jgi:hypothetical protein
MRVIDPAYQYQLLSTNNVTLRSVVAKVIDPSNQNQLLIMYLLWDVTLCMLQRHTATYRKNEVQTVERTDRVKVK